MLVVLDANVIVTGMARYEGQLSSLARVLHGWINRTFTICLSESLLNDVIRMLEELYFWDRISANRRKSFIASLRRDATMVALTGQISGVATHPEDDAILHTAVSAAADCLVTGDRRLLKLGPYQGVPIVSPADFLALLDRRPDLP